MLQDFLSALMKRCMVTANDKNLYKNPQTNKKLTIFLVIQLTKKRPRKRQQSAHLAKWNSQNRMKFLFRLENWYFHYVLTEIRY